MKFIDFENCDLTDNKIIDAQILFANETFDLKNVISGEATEGKSAVSVITPSQSVNVGFKHYSSYGGYHHDIATFIMRMIYPGFRNSTIDNGSSSSKIYFENRENNMFLLVTADGTVIFILPEEDKLNEYQYNQLIKYISELKKSNLSNIYFGDDEVAIDKLGKKKEELKKRIEQRDIPEQFDISNFDFSSCENDEDIIKLCEKYAEELEAQIAKKDFYKKRTLNTKAENEAREQVNRDMQEVLSIENIRT